jgi:hypothetical protein
MIELKKGDWIMENEIERIFNRQFERCKAELKEANAPQLYIDCVSKYLHFLKKDITKEIMEHGKEQTFNR